MSEGQVRGLIQNSLLSKFQAPHPALRATFSRPGRSKVKSKLARMGLSPWTRTFTYSGKLQVFMISFMRTLLPSSAALIFSVGIPLAIRPLPAATMSDSFC